jgi:hypothetical protein
MTRSPLPSWSAFVGLVVLSAVTWGCPGTRDSNVDTSHTGASPADTTAALTRLATAAHDSIVHEADSLYVYDVERDTLMVTDTAFPGPVVEDDNIPHMTIATARLKPNTPQPAHRIIARITSEAPYPPLGIEPGYNYVWRSSWSDADTASWVTKIVSRDSATSHDLTRDARHHEYTPGMSAREPRLIILKVHSIALGLCLDDPMCPTGHCGYY